MLLTAQPERIAPKPTNILDFGEALAKIELRFDTIPQRVKLNILQYWVENCLNRDEIDRIWMDMPTTMAELCASSIEATCHLSYTYIH